MKLERRSIICRYSVPARFLRMITDSLEVVSFHGVLLFPSKPSLAHLSLIRSLAPQMAAVELMSYSFRWNSYSNRLSSHKTPLPAFPMAAVLTDHVWTIEDIAALLENS